MRGRAAATSPAGPAAGHGDPRVTSPRPQLMLAAMCLSTFMVQIDVTIVNIALPRIQSDLGVNAGSLKWVISAYALTLAALIPTGGVLGDRFGRKRLFMIGIIVFAVGSVLCALSPNALALIIFRVVQGAGGALMLALTLAIITDEVPAENRARAIATWAAIGGTGFGVGPVAGGILLSFFGWSSVFWVNVPFATAGVILAVVGIRESRDRHVWRLDVSGVLFSTFGLLGVTFGLVESSDNSWGSQLVIVPFVLGIVLLGGFAFRERFGREPMIPMALLRAHSFDSATGVFLISFTAYSGVLFYVTLLYQDVAGWSALRTGLSWLLLNAPYLLMARSTGRLFHWFSAAVVITVGCVAAACGILALSFAAPGTSFFVTVIGYLVTGGAFGILVPGISNIAMRDVDSSISGIGSGVVNASRQIGSSVGLAILGSIGVSAAASSWIAETRHFPASIRARAVAQARSVGGGRIGSVTHVLGASFHSAAVNAFVHGYHLALLVGTGCLIAAALVAAVGLRQAPDSRHAQARQSVLDNTTSTNPNTPQSIRSGISSIRSNHIDEQRCVRLQSHQPAIRPVGERPGGRAVVGRAWWT
jgi:MFS transporter, DHA2 family, methylenomycin A resistance protein